jgi:hypothetical protein
VQPSSGSANVATKRKMKSFLISEPPPWGRPLKGLFVSKYKIYLLLFYTKIYVLSRPLARLILRDFCGDGKESGVDVPKRHIRPAFLAILFHCHPALYDPRSLGEVGDSESPQTFRNNIPKILACLASGLGLKAGMTTVVIFGGRA